ncbi:MAG: SDR family oxidoreductase [Alphaproteobacteria bacterium]|nr:SDR family oxidoreductase [Alphaproteobacteria bacterium]
MAQPFDMTDRHVFVAGGSSGINLGIAHGFAAAGAAVAIASRTEARVQAAEEELRGHGASVAGFAADVRDMDRVGQVLAEAVAKFGPIDVLVSGAAGNFVAPATGISSNGFRAVVDIDLVGTFHVLRAGFEHLRKPGAVAINISAPQAVQPMALQAHVCAAKAGVDMLTRALALEWGPDGVRVNAIIPGPIEDTEGMARLAATPEAEARLKANVPLRRYGTKAEIANMALFLASPLASYVTGVVIPVDGGSTVAGTETMMQAMQASLEQAT